MPDTRKYLLVKNNGLLESSVIKKYFLKPSDLIVCRAPTQVTTILGTCVAVCLFDPILRIGGINHFMLPKWDGREEATFRYGDVAIEALIRLMIQKGAEENRLLAKIFGGLDAGKSVFQIGRKNKEIAIQVLQERKIRIKAIDVGGPKSRKIRFSTWNHQIDVDFIQM